MSPATRTPTPSRRPTGAWPGSSTPTSTPTPRPRSGSRRSPAPTRCSPTRRSGRRTTAAATRSAAPAAASARAPGFSFTDIMDAFFGGGAGRGGQGGRGPRPRVRRGQDALIRLEIELAEAAFGVTRELKVDTAVLCTTCHGEGAAPGTDADPVRDLPRRRRGRPRAAVVPRRDPHAAPVRRLPRLRHRSSPTRAASARATAGSARAARSPSRSPPASTPAPASSSPSRARSAPAAARPATCTSRSTSRRTTRSPGTATTCTAPSRCR